jgi:transcriptional repressor NrdR
MHCPFCGNEETIVKDSRMCDDGEAIKRRRYCQNCERKFTTLERILTREITVIKKNGERRLFDRDKLMASIKMAVRKRRADDDKLKIMVNEIIKELEARGEPEILSQEIGELVLSKLKDFDKVAFVRFASVYKNFEDTKDFLSFIKNIK